VKPGFQVARSGGKAPVSALAINTKCLWCALAAFAQTAGALTSLAQSTSYTVQLLPGFNSIANHLNKGQNTLAEVIPSIPDGTMFYKFNNAQQVYYEPAIFLAGVGWIAGANSESAILRPGEGGFLHMQRACTVTLTGQPVDPHPRTDVTSGYNLLGCQSLGGCGFQEALGFAPRSGDRVYMFDRSFDDGLSNLSANASSIHTFGPNGWNTVPTFKQGRAAMVRLVGSPHITQGPASQTVLQGSRVLFSVTATGTSPLFYQWSQDGAGLPGQTNRTLLISIAQASSAGSYWVVVSNVFGSITSAPALLEVLTRPEIVEAPKDLIAVAGQTAEFVVVATGTIPLRYSWRRNGQLLPASLQGQPVLTLSKVQPADAGSYTVTVTNLYGATSSPPALLTVLEPPKIILEPVGQTNFPGATVVFAVEAVGTSPLGYTWRRNGVVIPGASNPTLTLRSVQLQDSGLYSVTVHNAAGAVDSAAVPLWVVEDRLPFADDFDKAGVIGGLSGTGRGSNVGATAEPREWDHFGKRGGKSVWLAFVAQTSGIVTFRTTGSSFDTLLAAYQGSSLTSLEEMASDDDSGGFLTSEIRFNAQPNVVYHIVVDGLAGAEGDIVLSWTLEPTADQLPMIVVQPTDQLVGTSNFANFFVFAEGSQLTYQWYRNNEPLGGQTRPTLDVPGSPNTVGTYFARVFQGARFVDSRRVLLEMSSTDPGAPPARNLAHDKFADAIADLLPLSPPPAEFLPLGNRAAAPLALVAGYVGTQIFSSYGSVSEPGEPVHCGVVGGASQWFYYIAPTNGTVFVNTEGSGFDTILAVYTGPGTSFSTLVPVACDNNSGSNGLTSRLQFTAAADTVYYIAVDGVAGATGTVYLNYRLLVPMVLSQMALNEQVARFNITATPSYPFTVQVSTNLANWNRLVVTSTPSGKMTIYESNVPTGKKRFYRARQNP
jgi:hypothetical protein